VKSINTLVFFGIFTLLILIKFEMESLKFNDIVPRTRAERAAMRDKERIEICRLKERTGGYHKFVDSAQVHNPDPISTHYISGKRIVRN
jgi:hypothetical protein